MTEDTMKYLTDEVGLSEEEARLRLRDEDLWILHPDQRFDEDLQGEEGVRMWEEAATIAHSIGNIVNNGPGTIQANPAITQLVWDLSTRAHEALRRARSRAQAPAERPNIYSVLNSLLSEASDLLKEAEPLTDEEAEQEIKARHAIAEAGTIVSRLRRQRREREAGSEPENGGRASA